MLPRYTIGLLLVISVVCARHVSAQTITSTLLQNQFACPGQRITFTCVIMSDSEANLALAWSSDEFIGEGGAQMLFAASIDRQGTRRASGTNPDIVAELTDIISESDGSFRLISTLNVTVTSNLMNPSVSCSKSGTKSTAMKSFTVLGEPNPPQGLSASQLECMYTVTITECLVAATWPYSANDTNQDGFSHFYVSINGTVLPNSSVSFINNNETAITRVFRAIGGCDINVVGVSIVNICGLQSRRNVTALNAERNTVIGEVLYEFCDALNDAGNENCSLIVFITVMALSMIFTHP